MYLFSLILTSFVISRVWGALDPSGSVSIDCGGQRTFTCTLAGGGAAAWTITGLMGVSAAGSLAGSVAGASARFTTTDTAVGPTSTITITGFNTSDNGGAVQCIDGNNQASVEGVAAITVGVPSCPTTLLVSSRSIDFSSATITWDQPTNSPPVTSYDVACNSSCTAMPCSSTCRVLSVSPCEDYSVTVLPMNSCGSSTGCTDNVVTVPSQGPPQCATVGVVNGSDPCLAFIFNPTEESPQPSTVVVSYHPQGESSLTESKNCTYPFGSPSQCTLTELRMGTYAFTLTPLNNCGSPSSTCPSFTETLTSDCNITVPNSTVAPTVSAAVIGGVSGGIAGGVIIGATVYGITIVTMRYTCYSYLGFLALLMCLCCPCCKGKARKSSSKQRIDSASPVTPPAQPPAQPPSDEYADPQAIRDRKERGKEDKDKIQYAAIDFSAGAGSGAGEVKIHQKEEPVIYTTVQHV